MDLILEFMKKFKTLRTFLSKQLEIRQAAKMAFARVDSTRRVRAALLRKSVPLRGPYNIGDRIVGREGRGSFWVIHGGVPIVVPESNMRPASTTEIMAKQLYGDETFEEKAKRSIWRE